MLTAQELGWLVVASSLVLGLAFCLGICLTLWCRKAAGGGHKMAPVTVIDPIDEKNGKPPSHASMLLPSVTLSEFGSEPRTPLSSVTPTSGASQQFHWSVGRGTPRPLYPVYYPSQATLSQGSGDPMRDIYGAALHDLPPKYATVYAAASPAERERMAQLTEQWRRSRGRSVDLKVPMVAGTLTYMPQPRPQQENAPPKPGRTRARQMAHLVDSESDRDSSLSSASERARIANGKNSSSRENGGEICGISGRRQLVSGLGYSDPEILNPTYDELDANLVKTEYASSKRRKLEKEAIQRRASRGRKKPRDYDVQSPILSKNSTLPTQYGADQCTHVTLSTGVKIGKIPLLARTPRNSRSRSSSRTRRVKEHIVRSAPESDVIQNLGIATGLSAEATVNHLVAAQAQEEESKSPVSSSEHDTEGGISPQASTRVKIRRDEVSSQVGSLGAVEVELKYQAVQQQLVMTILSALQLPARFHNPEAKLYVKILIGSSTRYTTPTVQGTVSPSFCCTLVHRVPSTRLHRTSIRISVCQLDLQNRRVVVGFATINLTELWPILHLTTKLTHNLTTQHLILSLSDSTPQHQLDCGGNITFGLLRDVRSRKLTVSSVTLQDLQSTTILDIGNCLVYLKATIYQGKEIVCWRRSQPVVLNRQRTHLVHLLHLNLESGRDSASPGRRRSASSKRSGSRSPLGGGSTQSTRGDGVSPIGRKSYKLSSASQYSGETSRPFTEGSNKAASNVAMNYEKEAELQHQFEAEDTTSLLEHSKEQGEETSLTEFIEGILSEKLRGMTETESLTSEDEKHKHLERQRSTSSSRADGARSPQSLSDDGTAFSSGHSTLQEQLSTEDEALAAQVMLVLSVRLKTLKRGGRCILGTVQLGEEASTPQGRSHWQRAAAGGEVPAAGTHLLTHT